MLNSKLLPITGRNDIHLLLVDFREMNIKEQKVDDSETRKYG